MSELLAAAIESLRMGLLSARATESKTLMVMTKELSLLIEALEARAALGRDSDSAPRNPEDDEHPFR